MGRIEKKIKAVFGMDKAILFVWSASPALFILNIILVLVVGALPVLNLYLVKLIVNEAESSALLQDKTESVHAMLVLISLAFLVGIIAFLFQQISSYVKEKQTLIVTDYVADLLHSKSIEQDLEFYENSQYFDTLHRAQMEGAFRPSKIVDSLLQLFQDAISLAGMMCVLFMFHWSMGMVLVLAALPGLFVKIKYSGKMYKWQRETTGVVRESEYYNMVLTSGVFAKELRLFGFGSQLAERYNSLRKKLREENLLIAFSKGCKDFYAQAGSAIVLFSCLAYITIRTVQGVISIGDMVIFFQAFKSGMAYLKGFLSGIAGLYDDQLFISNFYEFLDTKNKIIPPENPVPFPEPLKSELRFNGVNFKYPGTRRMVLKDLSFSIKPGEVVALVGENGSGKTTLIKLLCRLYDPVSGQILFDGVNNCMYHPDDLRRNISVVFQDYVSYEMSAKENIWLGNVKKQYSEEQIRSAAKKSGIDRVIDKLPDSYETILGRMFNDGEELSIGQWQKIALARAFYRDSQILVLDEPTSSLDALSEYELFLNFKELIKGKSAFLISHRFSTVKMADRILVLDGGGIIENGTHDQLMSKGGKYSEMFIKQAGGYAN